MMKKTIITLLVLLPITTFAAWNPFSWLTYTPQEAPVEQESLTLGAKRVFDSDQVGASPVTNTYLKTDGVNSYWATVTGGGGGGAGTFSTSTAWGTTLYNFPINASDILLAGYSGSGVATSSNAEFYVDPIAKLAGFLNGTKLGIGTTSPNTELHVIGGTRIKTGDAGIGLSLERLDASNVLQGATRFSISSNDSYISSTNGFSFNIGNTSDIGTAHNGTRAMVILPTSGNVGIGTTSPYAKLSVVGQVVGEYFTATSTTATSTFKGPARFENVITIGTTTNYFSQGINIPNQNLIGTSTVDIFNGQLVGFLPPVRNYNLYIGDGGKKSTTTTSTLNPVDPLDFAINGSMNGLWNTFVGMDAGLENGSGNMNTYIGSMAGRQNTNGDQNTFVGAVAGISNTSGYHNTFIGVGAGQNNTTGYFNTRIGTDNALLATGGSGNTSVGASAATYDRGTNSTWYGSGSGSANTTGSANVANGYNSMAGNITGSYNTGNGYQVMGIGAMGDENTADGHNALLYNTGSNNTSIGSKSGYNPDNNITQYRITSDTNMTFLGYGATKNNASALTNSTAIGNGTHVFQSNQVSIGSTTVTTTLLNGSVGIGTTTPRHKLELSNNDLGVTPVSLGLGGFIGYDAGIEYSRSSPFDVLTLGVKGGAGGWQSRINMGLSYNGGSEYTAMTIMDNAGSARIGMGTTTPGTLLSLGDTGNNTVNISTTATSTFGSGINIRSGCFSINGTCVGGGTVGSSASTTLLADNNTWSGLNRFGYASTTQIGSTGSAYFATAGGNVGIGTTGPGTNLHIYGTTANGLIVERSTDANNTIQFKTATKAQYLGYNAGADLFGISPNADLNNSIFVVKTTTGNVGVGTTTPGNKLEVNGAINVTGAATYNNNGLFVSYGTNTANTGSIAAISPGNTYRDIEIDTQNLKIRTGTSALTQVMTVTSAGNVGVGTTTPGTLLSLGNTGASTINISATATSTFGSGLNIRSGCYAVNGVCITGGGTSSNASTTLLADNNTFSGSNTFATLRVGSGAVNGFVTMVAPYSTTTWVGTTTLYLAPAVAAGTFTEIRCETNVGTVNVSLYDGTNRANLINASTTIGTFTLSTNNTFTANESIRVDMGTPASSPRQIACRLKYVYN